ncbi:MAG TPA: magnesium transporter [Coriobacteriia bacterium]|nr:magnesium transporter [Coriobacteriia bacterium]
MIYLSQMLGKPVMDSTGEEIGTINDIAIATGEVFPRVTSLAFRGPDKTPFMLSWRKFVAEFDGERIALNVAAADIRFSYLQPDEVLLSRDLLDKQIVDTQGMKVVRVNDLKLSESRNQMRLLGAEVGFRGILRGISPTLESGVERFLGLIGREVPENLIAWNYMDLLDRDLSQVKLSVTHKRLHELHPADVADIMEQLSASQRARVFDHLDNVQAAEAISELEDEYQADVIDDLSERRASLLLAEMDPDDAADIVGDLPREKAERLLRLMGLEDSTAIRGLLGYKEKTAGGIMTPEVTTVTDDMTVQEVIEHLRAVAGEQESVYYVYTVEGDNHLTGVISLRDLLLAQPGTMVEEIAERDLFIAGPDDDQEDVADDMSKYDLLALPVVDETGKLLGIVTVDDALDVLEEEAEEDLAIATGSARERGRAMSLWSRIWRRSIWVVIWLSTLVVVSGWATETRQGLAEDFGPFWLFHASIFVGAAALLLPLALRTAEEASSRAVAEIIEGSAEEDRPSLLRRLVAEGSVGLALGIACGIFAAGYLQLAQRGINLETSIIFGVVTMLAILVTVVLSSVLADSALRRADKGRPISATGLSTTAMLLSVVVYLGLSYVGGIVAAFAISGKLFA